jgi:hypothetical protein
MWRRDKIDNIFNSKIFPFPSFNFPPSYLIHCTVRVEDEPYLRRDLKPKAATEYLTVNSTAKLYGAEIRCFSSIWTAGIMCLAL